jgi:hypothetical protein
MQDATPEQIDTFIARWEKSGGHERGSGQHFLLEFCELLGLEKPSPPVAENERNAYTFERRVDRRKPDGSSAPNWIDLYKSAHFVLETKQGVNPRRDKSDPDQPLLPDLTAAPNTKSLGHGHRGSAAWDKALDRAHAQGERYIHLLPQDEGRPPFLIVCDVGHCFDIYAEFSGTGGQYEPFPTPRKRRVLLKDLHDPEVRDRFRKIWHDPHSLDPSKYAAKVTREVAKALADLAKSLEKDGHDPQVTAGFLQRCLFTMFAEDVGLLPKEAMLGMLIRVKTNPAGLVTSLQTLWKDMATGSDFSLAIHDKIPHFNGGLFQDATALPLRSDQIVYLIHAAKQDWSAVEPAIFGTLLERALDPRERHKLGAHYTPRSYVERLVRRTVIDPLRAEWESMKIAAAQLDEQGKAKDARAAVESFHHKLAHIRVLDPACGSGNFLYVALELLKRLEAEVLDLFEALGGDRKLEIDSFLIRPSNFLGIELNPRAAAIAQLVLWIGYFQWNLRTTGKADTNDRPLLPKQNSIECRDAVLAYDEKIPRKDPETGEILTIWNGRSTKPHPVTGKEVPDESARTVLFDYVNPKRAEWPQADFIVGNPPFIGVRKLIGALSESYVFALRKAYPEVPETTDLVGYWWHRAAELIAGKELQRFGLITTNSITQEYSRRILDQHIEGKHPVSLVYAIPDHPWVDTVDGAGVRVAMQVVGRGKIEGTLASIVNETPDETDPGTLSVKIREVQGKISAQLTLTGEHGMPVPLLANGGICFQGVVPAGNGFKLSSTSHLTKLADLLSPIGPIKPYLIGKDLVQRHESKFIIDCFGLSSSQVESQYPEIYQHLLLSVKPERDQNRRDSYREKWWLFAEPRPAMRAALIGLSRFIGTPYTAKYRPFIFIDSGVVPDAMVYAIASDDAAFLGYLSSTIHSIWAKNAGGTLEDRPRYNSNGTFLPFPFPALEEGSLKQRIRDLGERLDAHRKRQQALHPDLTLTSIYNVLEKLRAGEPLTDKEKKIHDDGLVTILKEIHDDLDAAVYEAYGWTDILEARRMLPDVYDFETGTISMVSLDPAHFESFLRERHEVIDQELLKRLVALNHGRAAEEKRGLVRWLRPEYQAPDQAPKPEQKEIELGTDDSSLKTERSNLEVLTWPDRLPDQVALIRRLLTSDPTATAEQLSIRFGRKSAKRAEQIKGILDTLKELGKY